MQLIDGQPVYSATDLVGYLACEHLTALDRAALAGLVPSPHRHDPQLEILQKRGVQHEQRYLGELREQGKRIVEIVPASELADSGERLRETAAATRRAMADGAEVIYQATFFNGHWVGHADFLLRVESPERESRLGPYHYEVADTKLARHVKASALLQMCSYVDQLEALQEVRPSRMHVVLGGNPRRMETFRVDDFFAYYRMVRSHFEAATGPTAGSPAYPLPAAPEPVEHCEVCRWSELCDARRRQDDHLSLVAGISRGQRRELGERGVDTLAALARLPLPLDAPPQRTSRSALERVREQARIQEEGRQSGRALHEPLLPIEIDKGLASLPPPSPGDLFLDLEGDPYAFDNGLDYLFGLLEPSRTGPDGEPCYLAFWSTDADGTFSLAGEKAAFETTIDLIMDRLKADPALHVYHYAPYEPTAFKRLMGRYGTREDEVDRLLRGRVLVDLYRAVRQGIRASVESYSIKRLEPLYRFERTVPLREATSSIVEFETWLELAEGERPGADHLDRIRAYNRDDVVSTWLLRDWLEERRAELLAEAVDVPRPAVQDGAPSPDLAENLRRAAELAERLTEDVPLDPAERDPEQQARWLLAQLLSWHRREEKSTWWLYYHLMNDLTDDERTEAKEPIGGLDVLGIVGETRRSRTYRYRFPAQEHAIEVAIEVHDPRTGKRTGTVEAIDEAERTIDLRRGRGREDEHPTSIVALQHVDTGVLRESLLRLGSWVAANGIDAPGVHRAARDLLLRTPPRLAVPPPPSPSPVEAEGTITPPPSLRERVGVEGVSAAPADGALRRPGEPMLEAARRLGLALEESVLPIQGPPGSGKTYTGARMIAALLAAGRRVGITANSHKVIGNLLGQACQAAEELGVAVRAVQKAEKEEVCAHPCVVRAATNEAVDKALTESGANLVAGTAWLWARPAMAGAVDTLFIDEAGQLSLANALAVAQAARSLVLLGDPQQLDQPLQGAHPLGAEASALGHLLAGAETMPPDRGLFLETTWRLHPELCRFTSEAFYEGRLTAEPHLAAQRLQAPELTERPSSAETGSGDEARGLVPRLLPSAERGTSPRAKRFSAEPLTLGDGVGLRLLLVPHAGNDNESSEEAAAVAKLARALVEGATWVDASGSERRLGWNDVLIVAPYNAQVGAIQRMLPPEARVGTVDKFQGQEAPVSIYSMATSSPEEAPRGMAFLYSRHRLNVATSRARCLAVLVCSPDLIRVQVRTPEQMRLANALCQFVEQATLSPSPWTGEGSPRIRGYERLS